MSAGDVYVYGDYEYRYNMGFMLLAWYSIENADFGDMGYPGWGVMRLDNKKTSYEPVIANINNVDVTVMLFTYAGCSSMTESPIIPNTIQCMWSTYYNCKGLTVTPVLPNGVGYFKQIFYGCTALTTAPTIPASAEVLKSIFWKCTNLKTYVGSQEADGYFLNYVIPSKVMSISCMFEECTSVISMPDLSKATSLTDMNAAFRGCTALTSTTTIPNTVKDMNATFHKCTSLVTAPTIPTGVEDLEFAFGDCTNLTGNVRVDAALTDDMDYLTCFTGTVKPIKIIVSCPTIVKQDWAGLYNNVTY